MKRVSLALLAWLVLVPAALAADRKPTEEEKAKIKQALDSVSCELGVIEVKDYGYRVISASCEGRGSWVVKLDQSFQVISRKRDD
ncbi:hypothetical protein [Microbulbifer sp. YPW16]|uniref:hypothetical protein n=1 Tax=Microbulbifer sp. YPW16 TaxID=2904242 RepID=UPI001E3A6C97|nr:hypothetical protein [Microbulbifer sp. YPW16]UHQ56844.1 hypothetical protein LVE68_07685 [Microbulbifer sp. YPW16]